MKNLKSLLLILTSCFIINCEPVLETPAGYNNGEVQGTVFYDSNNDGIYEFAPNTHLCLDGMPGLSPNNPLTISNGNGFFEFKEIEAGEHYVYGEKNIGNTYYTRIKYFDIEKKSTTNIELFLKKQF